jgi:lipopolysaccharide export system protein LptC
MWRVLRQVWEQLAIYLPLVLMGLLALLTYWMVRIAPETPEPQARRPLAHEVDSFMRGAVVRSYDAQGRLQNELTGDEMRHYADNGTVEVDRPRWQGVGPTGHLTRATALRATSTQDGSEVQLQGQAVVVREAGQRQAGSMAMQEFRSESLRIFTRDERVLSEQPVRFFSGGDEFSADSFHYDHVNAVVELQGRVRARITASTARTQP